MKRVVLAAAATALVLAGCAEGYGGYGYGGGLAYYDDFYGPFHDGYWGGDGFYYYRSGRGRPWTRDDAHHFRRDQAQGFHGVHSRGGFPRFHRGAPQDATRPPGVR